MIIERTLEKDIRKKIAKGKAIVIYGARQVGKTTLLKTIFGDPNTDPSILWLNGDNNTTRDQLSVASPEMFRSILENYTTVIIDEAQRINDIGLKLKILQDNFGDKVQFVATGSSSFELANKINEPLTGRKWSFWLPTLSLLELKSALGVVEEQNNLDNRLIYGSYPAVVTDPASARETVCELAGDSLYRDVLSLGEIIKTDKLRTILKALALQIGNQVSMTEIANLVGIDRKTVDKYISLLEQSFIVFRLPSYGKNLRNELKFSQKIFFYDVGIRNAIINDFRQVGDRQDSGVLFENYIISELKKKYPQDNVYFWRTTDKQEVDFVLERDGAITAIEIKENKEAKLPNAFVREYNPSKLKTINRGNYMAILED